MWITHVLDRIGLLRGVEMDGEQDVQRLLEAMENIARGNIDDLQLALEGAVLALQLVLAFSALLQELPRSRKPSRPRAELNKFQVIQGGKQ
jgi:hypothetical protein